MNSSNNPSGNGGMDDYNSKRQKNNEQARVSRLKKKENEIAVAKKKEKLEVTYVKLQKQINHVMQFRRF